MQLTDLLLRRSQACQRFATSAPLAACPGDLDLDQRIESGDPVAYFDALVEAVDGLEAVRDAIDQMLTEPAGAFRHGKGTVGRLKELVARAAAGIELFEQEDRRDGRRRDAAGRHRTEPANHGG